MDGVEGLSSFCFRFSPPLRRRHFCRRRRRRQHRRRRRRRQGRFRPGRSESEDAGGGNGVGVGVEFGERGDVSRDGEGAGHDDDFLCAQEGVWVGGGGAGEVGEGADGYDGYCVWWGGAEVVQDFEVGGGWGRGVEGGGGCGGEGRGGGG